MEAADGMIAVVRALPDATLAMSVLDGNKQYALLPNHSTAATVPMGTYVPVVPVQNVGTEPCTETRHCVHSHGAQAVDGRYASVYQMSHCNVHPTSPPVQLTEFPPQRAELSRGQGNFEVGGFGSGETSASPTRMSQSYRGGMNWPDRSVYTPRQSYHYEPNSFADSLRKYPHMSAERSAEVFERLINYTQMKSSYSKTRSPVSPTRSEAGPGHAMDRRSCASALLRTSRGYEPDVYVKPKIPDESPTRDTYKKADYEAIELKRSLFGRNYDVRYIRDVTRRARESVRSVSTYPYNHPVCPPIKERYDHLPPQTNQLAEIISINSVHMETQAEIPMVSKEVTTLPREQPSMRNVAVPLSPSSSQSDSAKLSNSLKIPDSSSHFPEPEPETKLSHKSIQTNNLTDLSIKPRKSVHTCISSIDIANQKKVKTCRKTKSQEEIRINDDLEEEILQVIKDLSVHSDVDANFCVRNCLLRKLRRIMRTERSDRVKIKLGKCVRDQLYSHINFKHFTRELSNELISNIQESNMFLRCYGSTKVLRTDILSAGSNSDKCVNELIKEWLDDIPVKPLDYLGRPVNKEQVLHAVASKIKFLIMNKIHYDRYGSLKPKLLDILEDVPIDINSRNKICFLNRIVSDLVRKIKDIFSINTTDRRRWQKVIDLDKTLRNKIKKEAVASYILPTDNELKQFAKQELKDFTTKFNVTICPSTEKEIQIELIDILIDSFNALRYGDDKKIKEEILIMLSDLINISENEGIYFVNNLIYNFKDMLKELHTDDVMPQTFVVLQNSVQNSCNQTADYSIEGITNQDINNNLNAYTQQIVDQINEWMDNLQGLHDVEGGFKKIVAQDLAGDIVDRHKYLELNCSNRRTDADELEHLKYQIFKWVNKLVGEDNLETIDHASQLMQRIQSIPVPMLTRPAVAVLNLNTSPTCYKKSNPSEQQRASNPGKKTCPKEIQYENRRQSSPYAISYESTKDEQNKCCAAEVDTKNFGVMTDPKQKQIRTDSSCCPIPHPPPIRMTVFTETDMSQIPITCPRGTSMSNMECPKIENSTNRRFSGPAALLTGPVLYKAAAPKRNIEQQNTSRPHSPDKPRPLCCVIDPKDPTSTIKELNDEYDHYLENWVSQIPIITSNPQEQALIETMRKGIYNGVWKARIKLQMNPTAMSNRFYYQDMLDDELEELLDLLPQSSELTKNKQMLKNQIIDKTANMNEQIYNSSTPTSYKQQLMENVGNHLPRKSIGFAGSDVAKLCEDIHKLNLAETYIMYSMYRFKDNVKANVYKKKLMKQIEEFFDNLKRTQGIGANEIDFITYKDEIMHALHQVPQPSDETMREEADEVLIGLEIEQWFSDLPLYATDNNFETLCRKRYRNTLAKKVHDMEKEKKLIDCEDELRHEITRFMGKLPLREREIENMPFMVEELVNRLKNRSNDLVEGSEKRRLMPLISPYGYDEFSRDMPLCSSFSDAPGARRAQVNESSYLIRDGERAADKYSPLAGQFNYVHDRGETPDTNQWLTLHDNGTPQARQSHQGPDPNQQRQSLPVDEAPHARLLESNQDCSQQLGILHNVEELQARQPGQRLHTSAQNPLDCCQLQNVHDGAVGNQSSPRNYSYREPESRMREATIKREQSPHTSRLQETHISGPSAGLAISPDGRSPGPALQSPYASRLQETCISGPCAGQAISPDRRSPGPALQNPYESRLQETCISGSCAGQAISPDGRSPGPALQSPYTSRLQETYISGPCAGQATSPDPRSIRQAQEQSHYKSKLQETRISGTCAGPVPAADQRFSMPASGNFSGNANRRSFQGDLSPEFPSNVCPKIQESRGEPMTNSPERLPVPGSLVPEVSSRPYDGQGQFSSRQSPSCFSQKPAGSSTPQQVGPPPRVSRPKKRTRHIVDKTRRDTVRKRLEMSESDDSCSEDVKCRCMERIWRCRKKRSIYTPCEECDLDFPPCFPLRFSYPYYF